MQRTPSGALEAQVLSLGDVQIDVIFKPIKNVHLSVHPPTGRVRISAPKHMNLDTIRLFAIDQLGWIKRQQRTLRQQEREPPREFLERESHYVWGQRYLLEVVERQATPRVELLPRSLRLQVRPGADQARKQAVLAAWYRAQIRAALPDLLATWQPRIGVAAKRIDVRRMKTKWGSCSPKTQTIRLNTELARKPREALTYILVHELVHLLEPSHNARFQGLMAAVMPLWRERAAALNASPLVHEDWGY